VESKGGGGGRKGLEERVADLALDVEGRVETSFLVTFYFTKKILPNIHTRRHQSQIHTHDRPTHSTDGIPITYPPTPSPEDEAVQFVQTYASYLNLHASLVAASDAHASLVLRTILDLAAKHDPNHWDGMKTFLRNDHGAATDSNSIVLYEPGLLSCLLVQLPQIVREEARVRSLAQEKGDECSNHPPLEKAETETERVNIQGTTSTLVEAYPDLKPWQVRSADPALDSMVETLLRPPTEYNADDSTVQGNGEMVFYYEYLSLLLENDPAARRRPHLVHEWAVLSTSPRWNTPAPYRTARRRKFLRMASPSPYPRTNAVSNNNNNNNLPNNWYRNIPSLMDLALRIANYNLALELIARVVGRKEANRDLLHRTIVCLRAIAEVAVDGRGAGRGEIDAVLMRRVVVLFRDMAGAAPSVGGGACVDVVVDELVDVLERCGVCGEGDGERSVGVRERSFVALVTRHVAPLDVMRILARWSKTDSLSGGGGGGGGVVYPALRMALERGARDGVDDLDGDRGEISGALVRIRRVRADERRWDGGGGMGGGGGMYGASGLGGAMKGNRRWGGNDRTTKMGIWQGVLRGTAVIDK